MQKCWLIVMCAKNLKLDVVVVEFSSVLNVSRPQMIYRLVIVIVVLKSWKDQTQLLILGCCIGCKEKFLELSLSVMINKLLS